MAVLRELRGYDSDSDGDSILGASYDDKSSSVARVDDVIWLGWPVGS